MSRPDREEAAVELMLQFAARTGVTSDRPPRRYLWTDAFAVCNLLGLARAWSSAPLHDVAVRLVDQVHHVLGRHRPDDPRAGRWLSGLSLEAGEEHPTRGGLRIGKPLPERGPDAPFDPDAEWERDGQYYHYLTKWMHALDQLSRVTGDRRGNRLARELAAAAHAGFTYAPRPGARKRMHWKMSIDLSRPLVPSMGHHDPLDGLVTYLQLRAGRGDAAEGPDLAAEIAEMTAIADGLDWTTHDPLGLGGLMTDAYRLDRLIRQGAGGEALLAPVLAAASAGAAAYLRPGRLEQPASRRLAFRELGLAIGLHALERLDAAVRRDPGPYAAMPAARRDLERLATFSPWIEVIESFWSQPEHRRSPTWLGHRDINEVMLATSLAPAGYLSLGDEPSAPPLKATGTRG
ncbi:hypothetical protein SAMN02745121_08142 [Nannocystis exedens]|uniref:Uncharacterized protein n=1 Tax=Nannocystis exedens TaxID=54 RepID=A0A1I2HRB7_9BACT|nr:hypothetical protein [Nannocystis exedens]PCC69402.1 hypothetical protein NAEX_02424 [Nannocystis exedens]SFF32222.1 hypothetical protein SAMN02745121_08142 [Nannocystis exedens]